MLLAEPEPIAAASPSIGFCFGGTMSLELARAGTDLVCVVGFHSGLGTGKPAGPGDIAAKVLVSIGTEDPIIPPEQRGAFEQEMRAGGVDWRMNLYGGQVHSFTNPAADGSNPAMQVRRRRRRPLVAGDARPLQRGVLKLGSARRRVRIPGVGIGDERGDVGRQPAGGQVGQRDVLEDAAQRGAHGHPQGDERLLLAPRRPARGGGSRAPTPGDPRAPG